MEMIRSLLNLATEEVTVRQKTFPVLKQGTGRRQCLAIGIGSLMQKTLSSRFFENFTVYSTDAYWLESHRLPNPQSLTMVDLIADVWTTARQLKLNDYFILSHSCFGLVAIEAAKRPDPGLRGVIAIGSPTYWSTESLS